MFDGSLYQQVDGVAMKSPLGPLLANIFMTYVEDLLFKSNLNEEIGFGLDTLMTSLSFLIK